MARAKQPVSVGGIEFDALIEAEESYEADVPEYPTEKGFSVSDTIVLKPESLVMTLFITDTPVTWRSRHGAGPGRVEAVEKQLKELYFKKLPVEVVRSDKVFTDMAITSISFKKTSETGYAREVPISLKKIVVTESKTVTIPDSYGKSGTTGASAGTAGTSTGTTGGDTGTGTGNGTDGDNKPNGSILYNVATGLGVL